MSDFLFKDCDGQTPLPYELQKGLKIKTIQTVGELDEYEEDNIAKGLIWLAKQKSNPCKYDFWLKLHKKLFENVWSWAGKIRTHELANPEFKLPHEIWPELYQLEMDLDFWIKSKTFSDYELAARFHERIETIHPFANGNGRFGRIITEQICCGALFGEFFQLSLFNRKKVLDRGCFTYSFSCHGACLVQNENEK